ncbi:hypothetical protein EJ06DRAFT_534007 [Trichodelitschia bisporula]|uniref:Uncharacterized protein n=1 Tax=Trichodelitschia bisporula TaxID=703511 RepID=A0A6G1HK50_9PEZI|nr:hypothetical protein EJ06DRAFT_534007 [Trichodelitschia bisporula]
MAPVPSLTAAAQQTPRPKGVVGQLAEGIGAGIQDVADDVFGWLPWYNGADQPQPPRQPPRQQPAASTVVVYVPTPANYGGGRPTQAQGAWGQPAQQQGAWGQPKQQQGAWGGQQQGLPWNGRSSEVEQADNGAENAETETETVEQ